MKSLLLAAAVALGIAFTAGTADAQYRRDGVVYSYPTYSYPTYSYPTYSYPTSSSPTYTYSVPSYYPSVVYVTPTVVTSGSAPVISNSSYSAPASPGTPYTVYTGVTPSGVYYGGYRAYK